MKNLAIIGAGGHGRVIAEIAELCGWERVVFFDDNYQSSQCHWTCEGSVEDLLLSKERYSHAFVAVGDNKVRQKLNVLMSSSGIALPTLIHPRAVVSKYAEIDEAVVVMANATINPFASLSSGVIVNTNAIVEHDCVIGSHVHISPAASLAGGVSVGSCSWVGMNSTIIQGLTVGSDVIIGASSVVLRDVPDGHIVVGSPAKKIKENKYA